jgi:amino acid adenylation domain-containing protein
VPSLSEPLVRPGNPFDAEHGQFYVLVNVEGVHALWPDFVDVPAGWQTVFGAADRAGCHGYVEAHWGDMRMTSSGDDGPTVPDLFRLAVSRAQDGPAIVFQDSSIGYAELDTRTNRLARHLIALGVGPESLVAVALPRSVDLIVTILAVFKAGGAYLPLDLNYPPARLTQMTRDARPELLVRSADGIRPAGDMPEVVIDAPEVRAACARESGDEIADEERLAPLSAAHLLYVIFTSGSTGVPKGVAITHAGVADLVRTQADRIGVGPGDRVLQWASISFDAAFWDISLALFSGATLVVAAAVDVIPGTQLQDTLARHDVTHAVLPPVALSVTDDRNVLTHGMVMSTGDTCTSALVAKWAPGRRMFNGYGPTEVTVGASISGPITDAGEVSIGTPFVGGTVYVLDERLRELPDGQEGELYLGGSGVARGYLNRPALTASRFPADPFGKPGSRMYRSGDRGRRDAGGELFFAGRVDAQVKVRGFRVELGEIETSLAAHHGVEIAVARMVGELGAATIVGYVTTVAGSPVSEAELRRYVARALPEHMVPTQVVLLDRFPTTINGKIDRKALDAYAPAVAPAAGQGTPSTAGLSTEEILCGIVQDLLGLPHVTPDDNFFELGGHSFLATRLAGRLRSEFGVKLTMHAVFSARTLADLARAVTSLSGSPA